MADFEQAVKETTILVQEIVSRTSFKIDETATIYDNGRLITQQLGAIHTALKHAHAAVEQLQKIDNESAVLDELLMTIITHHRLMSARAEMTMAKLQLAALDPTVMT